MPDSSNYAYWEMLDRLVADSEVIVDRPGESEHPAHPNMIYPLDYGYLAGTTSADGGGIDVWLGASGKRDVVGIICTVDLVKRDSEIKILMGCTRDEMRTIVNFLNEKDKMHCLLVMR